MSAVIGGSPPIYHDPLDFRTKKSPSHTLPTREVPDQNTVSLPCSGGGTFHRAGTSSPVPYLSSLVTAGAFRRTRTNGAR